MGNAPNLTAPYFDAAVFDDLRFSGAYGYDQSDSVLLASGGLRIGGAPRDGHMGFTTATGVPDVNSYVLTTDVALLSTASPALGEPLIHLLRLSGARLSPGDPATLVEVLWDPDTGLLTISGTPVLVIDHVRRTAAAPFTGGAVALHLEVEVGGGWFAEVSVAGGAVVYEACGAVWPAGALVGMFFGTYWVANVLAAPYENSAQAVFYSVSGAGSVRAGPVVCPIPPPAAARFVAWFG